MVPVDRITIPEQDIKLMDKETYRASLGGSWLIYDGGMRKGYRGANGRRTGDDETGGQTHRLGSYRQC